LHLVNGLHMFRQLLASAWSFWWNALRATVEARSSQRRVLPPIICWLRLGGLGAAASRVDYRLESQTLIVRDLEQCAHAAQPRGSWLAVEPD